MKLKASHQGPNPNDLMPKSGFSESVAPQIDAKILSDRDQHTKLSQ
jgi:hypothetical protein